MTTFLAIAACWIVGAVIVALFVHGASKL